MGDQMPVAHIKTRSVLDLLPGIAGDLADFAKRIDHLWANASIKEREAMEECGLFGSLDFHALAVDAENAQFVVEELHNEPEPKPDYIEHGTHRVINGRVA